MFNIIFTVFKNGCVLIARRIDDTTSSFLAYIPRGNR